MIEEIEIGETDIIPRQRWFFFGYVLTITRSGNHATLHDAIKQFKEIHGITESEEALKRRYYRLLELHTNCLRNGI